MRSGRIFIWLLVLAAPVLLSGCTLPNTAKQGRAGGVYKVGSPYQVGGNWYYPKIDYNYDQAGVASWYGQNFHGKLTANGEKFDMRRVSAAHKTLPLPSIVRVTNLENGRSLIIRVNDRGPFVRGRIIDLSKRAAELLGFADKGTAMVRVQVQPGASRRIAIASGAQNLPDFGPPPPRAAPSVEVSIQSLDGDTGNPPKTPPGGPLRVASVDPSDGTPPPFDAMSGVAGGTIDSPVAPVAPAPEIPAPQDVSNGSTRQAGTTGLPESDLDDQEVAVVTLEKPPLIFIQAGAFARFDNANRLRVRLTTIGPPVKVTQIYVTNQPMFRVRVGPLKTVREADATLERLIRFGFPEAQIVID